MSTLTCPKCESAMRTYERNQVHVDQCTGCGGLFLDRGELESLVAAENAWHAQPQQPQYSQAPQQGYQEPYRESRGGSSKPYGGYEKRRKSFLSELFD